MDKNAGLKEAKRLKEVKRWKKYKRQNNWETKTVKSKLQKTMSNI